MNSCERLKRNLLHHIQAEQDPCNPIRLLTMSCGTLLDLQGSVLGTPNPKPLKGSVPGSMLKLQFGKAALLFCRSSFVVYLLFVSTQQSQPSHFLMLSMPL